MEQNLKHTDGTTTPLNQRAAASGITRMEQSRAFMGDDTLTIEATAAQPLDFRIGDTISVHGHKYTLNRLPTARKDGERKYNYTFTLEGAQYDLITAQFLLFDSITDDAVAHPSQHTLDGMMMSSLTGTASDILKMIVLNANRVHGDEKWAVGSVPSGTDTLNFTLQDGTCLEALQALAEQWELEWNITTDSTTGQHTIALAIEPTTTPAPIATFSYGRTGGLYTIERRSKQDDAVTRLYAYGSTQNIPTSYLTEANTSRLCIKNGTQRKQHLSYVENATLKAQIGLRERVETFDDIYPQRVGTVTGIYTTGDEPHLRFRDNDMFNLNEKDEEGNTKYLIAGATAKVTFQTGQMAGYTFDIEKYTDSSRSFKIKELKEEGDLVLPSESVSTLRIARGDKYILTDINLPEVYITDAETQLKQAATKKLAQLNADLYQYTIELDSRYIRRHATEWGRTADNPFNIGDFITIADSDLGITTTLRLAQYTYDIMADAYTLSVELYQPRIKTTQTTHRRRVINDRWNRIFNLERINAAYDAGQAALVAADAHVIADNASTAAGNATTAAGNAVSRADAAYTLAEGMTPLQTFNLFKGETGEFGLLLSEVAAARNGKATLSLRFGDFLLEQTFNTFKTNEFTPTKTKADSAYQLPSGGIPTTDLAQGVRTSLGKADTALQEHQSLDGLLKNTDVTLANGIITIKNQTITPITQHQDISGKQDVISDLATIRSGAALGATAIQTHQDISGKANLSLLTPTAIDITDLFQASEDRDTKTTIYTVTLTARQLMQYDTYPRIIILDSSGNVVTPTGIRFISGGKEGAVITFSETQGKTLSNQGATAVIVK